MIPVSLAALALLAILLPIWSNGDAHYENGAFDPEPTGLVEFVELAELEGMTASTLLTSPYLLEDVEAASSVLIITRLDRLMNAGEVAEIVAFVEKGGTLLVASSDPRVNSIASRFGVEFDGHAVLSRTNGVPTVLSNNGDRFSFSALTALHVSPTAQAGSHAILLETPSDAFLDLNGDERVDEYDRDGPFIAAVEVRLPEGGLAKFFSTPTLLQNDGLADNDVREYVRTLLADVATDGGTAVVFEGARDHAARPLADGLSTIEAATRHSQVRPWLAIMLPIATALVIWRYRGPAKLTHVYSGSAERHREIEKVRLVTGLRELILERARERAGLTGHEFGRLAVADRRSFVDATIASVLSGSRETRAFAVLHLFEEQ